MALAITANDLKTHIYAEQIDEITREDTSITDTAIASAISLAKGYLSRYDTTALLGNETTDATVNDLWLQGLVKDIAVWNIVKLGNPNINYEHIKECYEDAANQLRRISEGKITPSDWPLYIKPPESPNPNAPVSHRSRDRQTNYF